MRKKSEASSCQDTRGSDAKSRPEPSSGITCSDTMSVIWFLLKLILMAPFRWLSNWKFQRDTAKVLNRRHPMSCLVVKTTQLSSDWQERTKDMDQKQREDYFEMCTLGYLGKTWKECQWFFQNYPMISCRPLDNLTRRRVFKYPIPSNPAIASDKQEPIKQWMSDMITVDIHMDGPGPKVVDFTPIRMQLAGSTPRTAWRLVRKMNMLQRTHELRSSEPEIEFKELGVPLPKDAGRNTFFRFTISLDVLRIANSGYGSKGRRPTIPLLERFHRRKQRGGLSALRSLPFSIPRRIKISDLLLFDSSSMSEDACFRRVMTYKKHYVLDMIDTGNDKISFDVSTITNNDQEPEIADGLCSVCSGTPIPLELLCRLLEDDIEGLKSFQRTFKQHLRSLRGFIYDNKARRTMIDTIMSNLKVLDSLKMLARKNVHLICKFFPDSEDGTPAERNYSRFWYWKNGGDDGDGSNIVVPSLREAWPEYAERLEGMKTYYEGVDSSYEKWDEELRGMMNLLFNLVSIDEAYQSREQNTSMKRLSWITFIFLPLLFISSLFGMNINLVENNPEWYWYMVWCVPGAVLVFAVWILYRIYDKRRFDEEKMPFKMA